MLEEIADHKQSALAVRVKELSDLLAVHNTDMNHFKDQLSGVYDLISTLLNAYGSKDYAEMQQLLARLSVSLDQVKLQQPSPFSIDKEHVHDNTHASSNV